MSPPPPSKRGDKSLGAAEIGENDNADFLSIASDCDDAEAQIAQGSTEAESDTEFVIGDIARRLE